MRSIRNVTLLLVAFATAAGAQQDTTRRATSDRRITTSKGEVVSSRVDTIYVARTDTIRTTTTRVDTLRIVAPPPMDADVSMRPLGHVYWGLYTGSTAPEGNIDRLYTKGFHGGGVLGWEQRFVGLRLDAAMSQIGREQGRNAQLVGTGTPLMLHVAGSAKVKPLSVRGWALYGIAGLNYNRYRRIATVATTEQATHCGGQFDGVGGSCYFAAQNARWSDKFGFSAGAGLDFHIGSQDMFLEARGIAVQATGARTWFVPVSLGLRYF